MRAQDSKRAMDEYISSIFMGGLQTIAMHNTCEDSLLASPLILDLAIITEMMTRIQYKTPDMKVPYFPLRAVPIIACADLTPCMFDSSRSQEYESFGTVLSLLAYMLKAPMVAPGTPVVNALFKQHRSVSPLARVLNLNLSLFLFLRSCITNVFCAVLGLPPDNDMLLEHKTKLPTGRNAPLIKAKL